MVFHFGHDSSGGLPARRLVGKALVQHEGLASLRIGDPTDPRLDGPGSLPARHRLQWPAFGRATVPHAQHPNHSPGTDAVAQKIHRPAFVFTGPGKLARRKIELLGDMALGVKDLEVFWNGRS